MYSEVARLLDGFGLLANYWESKWETILSSVAISKGGFERNCRRRTLRPNGDSMECYRPPSPCG